MVERGDPRDAHPFSDGHDRGIDEPETQVRVCLDEVGCAGIVLVQQVHDLERAFEDGIKEAHFVFRSESPSKQRTSLRYHRCRNDESFFGAKKIATRSVMSFALATRFEEHARVNYQHDGSVETERAPGTASMMSSKVVADRFMLTQEFVCQLFAGAMNVERLMHRHIGAADECLERPSAICSLNEFADELSNGDAALVSPFGNNGRYVVWQMNDRRHRAQRTHRPREAVTNSDAV